MINVLYIHGLGSSSESSTGKLLESLNNESFTFYHPTFSLSPLKAMEEINSFIKENNIDIVVGSSLGGFYALQSDCNFGVVINPALTPMSDIKNAIGYGEHNYVNGEGTYVIDGKFIDELEQIIRRDYKGENPNEWYKNFKKYLSFAAIFGAKDEYFSHYLDFKSMKIDNVNDLVTIIDDMPHRFDKKHLSTLTNYISQIAEILEMCKKASF